MLQIPVSMDKMTVEFKDIHMEFFIEYVFRDLKKTSYVELEEDEEKNNKAFVYTVKVKRGSYKVMCITYQHIGWGTTTDIRYSLWLRINPKNLESFTDVFKTLRENSSGINFVRGEIAFDIPRHLDDVLLFPYRKRNFSYCVDTTYYGEREDQGKHGYCRFYDKKKQLKQVKKVEIEGERSRVEITWFPEYKERFLLSELPAHTPDFNKMYQCFVITDRVALEPKWKSVVDALASRVTHVMDYESNDRRRLRKALTSQTKVDFNALLEQQWKTLVEPFVRLILID